MTDVAHTQRYDRDLLRRALVTADRDGEAALNALLYAAGALMMSAVILVITTPAVLGALLATTPWLFLALAGWWWLAPALRNEVLADQQRRQREDEVRSQAVEILLDDLASPHSQRAAAQVILDAEE